MPFLNGVLFTILTLFILTFISLLHANRHVFTWKKKGMMLPLFFTISTTIACFFLLKNIGDTNFARIADSLKNTSFVEQLFTDLHLQQGQWEIGIPALIAFFSAIFQISTVATAKILHAFLIVLLDILIAHSLARGIELRGKRANEKE